MIQFLCGFAFAWLLHQLWPAKARPTAPAVKQCCAEGCKGLAIHCDEHIFRNALAPLVRKRDEKKVKATLY